MEPTGVLAVLGRRTLVLVKGQRLVEMRPALAADRQYRYPAYRQIARREESRHFSYTCFPVYVALVRPTYGAFALSLCLRPLEEEDPPLQH